MNTTTTQSTSTRTAARTVRHSLGLTALAVPMAAAITLGAGTAAHAESEPMPTTPTAWSATVADPEVVPNPDIPEGPGDLEVEIPCWQTDTCPAPEEPELNPDIPPGPGDFEEETPCWETDTCPVPEDDDEDDDTPKPTNPTCEGLIVLEEPLEPAPSDEDGPKAEDAGDGPVRTNPEGPVRTNPDDDGDGPVRTNPPEEEDCDDEGEPGGGDGSGTDDGFDKPTRIDAGSAFGDNGLQLSWLLPGGLLVSAGGMAFASRRLRGEPR